MIAPALLSQIKERADLVAVVNGYVPLNRYLKACCPFHQEKSPSFSVNPKKQYWKCFGCGKGGDVIKFVMLIEGKSFNDAVNILALKVGLSVAVSERFKCYLERRQAVKQDELQRIKAQEKRVLANEDESMEILRRERRSLPPRKAWNSWDAKDYLKDQMIEHKADVLRELARQVLDKVRKGERIDDDGKKLFHTIHL